MIPFGILVALVFIEVVIQLIGDPRIADNEEFLDNQLPHYRLGTLGLLMEDPLPEIRFTLTPGFETVVGQDRYRVNHLGLRGYPVPLVKPAGTKRILVVGDSYAFGLGVDEPDTISAQLQDELRKDHPEVDGVGSARTDLPGSHGGPRRCGGQGSSRRRAGLPGHVPPGFRATPR